MNIHVLPNGDIYPHDNDSVCDCSCNPTVEIINGEALTIHNSYDGREIFEAMDAENKKEQGE